MGWLDWMTPKPRVETPQEAKDKWMREREQRLAARKAPRDLRMAERGFNIADIPKAAWEHVGAPVAGFVGKRLSEMNAVGASPVTDTNIYNTAVYQERQKQGLATAAEQTNYSPVGVMMKAPTVGPLSAVGPVAPLFTLPQEADMAVFHNADYQAALAAGYKSPWGEIVKTWKADPENPGITGVDAMKKIGLSDKGPLGGVLSPAFLAGLATDTGSAWTTYATAGYGAATKLDDLAKVGAAGEKAWTLAELADKGVDVARGLDPATKQLAEIGALRMADMPEDIARTVARAGIAESGQAVAGTQRKLTLPFLRTVDGKLAGADIALPTLRNVSAEEIAARNAREFPTLAAKMARWSGKGVGGKVFEAGGALKEASAAERSAAAAGETLDRVGDVSFKLGTRGADLGGFKIAGMTVFKGEAIANTTADIIDGLRRIPGVSAVEGLFNTEADIARRNNPLLTKWARALKAETGGHIGRNSVRSQRVAEELDSLMSSREADLVGMHAPDIVAAGDYAAVEIGVEGQKDALKHAADLQQRLHVDDTAASIAAAREAAYAPQLKPLERLAAIDARKAAIDAQAEAMIGTLKTSEGKTAITVSQKLGVAKGKAVGLEKAQSEAQRAADQFDKLADYSYDAVSKEADRAQEFAAKAGKTGPYPASTTLPGKAEILPVIPPEAPRTAPTLTPKGNPKTYDSWDKSVQDALDATTARPDAGAGSDLIGVLNAEYPDGVKPTLRVTLSGKGASNYSEEWLRANMRYDIVVNPNGAPLDEAAQRLSEMYPHLLPENASGDDLLQALVKTKATRKTAKVTAVKAADFGTSNVDDTVAILSGRVNTALDAGDVALAEKYAANLDDYAEWYARPVLDPEDVFGADMIPGSPLSAEIPDFATLIAHAKGVTPEAVQKVRVATKTVGERAKAAYATGRGTGAREAMRGSVRSALRAENLAAAAEGRVANYGAIIASLGSDAERLSAAAEVLRMTERESGRLAVKRAVTDLRLTYAKRKMTSLEAGLKAIDASKAEAEEFKVALEAFTAPDGGYVDYTRLTAALVDQGVAPVRAQELTDIAKMIETTYDAPRFAGLKAEGLTGGEGVKQVVEKQGPGIAAGYTYGMDAETPGAMDFLSRGQFWKSRSARIKARDQVIEQATGIKRVDTELIRSQDKRPFLQQAGIQSSSAPRQEVEAVHRTPRERLGAGLSTEIDIRRTEASAENRALNAVTKAHAQDSIASAVGWEIGEADQVPMGYTTFPITRNGETTHFAVPVEVKNWYDKIDSMFIADESTNVFFHAFDRLQNVWKKMATSWNPAFHGRNAISNYWMAHAGDAADLASWEKGGRVYLLGKDDALISVAGRKQTAAQWRTEAREFDVTKEWYGPAQVDRSIGSILDKQKNMNTVTGAALHPLQTGTEVGSAIGTTVEDSARMGVYFASLEKGMSQKAAALNVDRILYNYSAQALSPFERNVMKRAFPFYTWTRRNLPRMLAIAATQPGKFTQMKHVIDNLWAISGIDPATIPQYQRDTLGVPIGDTIVTPGLPISDIGRFGEDLGPLAPSGLTPVLKIPLQYAPESGIDFFTGKALSTYEGDLTKAPGYLIDMDNRLSGSGPWEALKASLGMEYRKNYDGDMELQMDPKQRMVLKESSPWLEKLGKMSDPARTPNDVFAFWTGLKTTPYVQSEAELQTTQARIKALADKKRALEESGQWK